MLDDRERAARILRCRSNTTPIPGARPPAAPSPGRTAVTLPPAIIDPRPSIGSPSSSGEQCRTLNWTRSHCQVAMNHPVHRIDPAVPDGAPRRASRRDPPSGSWRRQPGVYDRRAVPHVDRVIAEAAQRAPAHGVPPFRGPGRGVRRRAWRDWAAEPPARRRRAGGDPSPSSRASPLAPPWSSTRVSEIPTTWHPESRSRGSIPASARARREAGSRMRRSRSSLAEPVRHRAVARDAPASRLPASAGHPTRSLAVDQRGSDEAARAVLQLRDVAEVAPATTRERPPRRTAPRRGTRRPPATRLALTAGTPAGTANRPEPVCGDVLH